jgi:D-amino-acid dehydrogenase
MERAAIRARTCVVGGGLAGLTTAQELINRGQPVTVLEQHAHVALEASFANGALLSASMADPWNGPGVYRALLTSLCDPAAPLKLRPRALPSLIDWGTRFLLHSSPRRHRAATRANYSLARYSIERTRSWRSELQLDYDAAAVGTMKLFRDRSAMAGPLALAEMLAPLGLRTTILDADGAVAAEPQLQPIRERIAGALRFPDDETGDARRFCEALAGRIAGSGDTLKTGAQVLSVEVERGRVTGVRTRDATFPAERVILACGNGTVALAARLGVRLPIRPVKGYSITIDMDGDPQRPVLPVVDDTLHAAVVPIGHRLRVAGTVEFAGHDLSLPPDRIDNLLRLFAAVYPRIAARVERSLVSPWTGLRPMSADGLPYIGPTPIRGLYVNAGHGHLGWTLAVGSAALLADLLTGCQPAIDPQPYSVAR